MALLDAVNQLLATGDDGVDQRLNLGRDLPLCLGVHVSPSCRAPATRPTFCLTEAIDDVELRSCDRREDELADALTLCDVLFTVASVVQQDLHLTTKITVNRARRV